MRDIRKAFFLQTRIVERFLNTFLQLPFLWDLFINYRNFSQARSTSIINNILLKVFWFWPRLVDAVRWKEGSVGGLVDPMNYVEISRGEMLLVEKVSTLACDKYIRITDLGCNIGRFLNELYSSGFSNLTGVDISPAARAEMKNVFPGLCEIVDFKCMTVQQYLTEAESQSVSILYSRGAMVEIVHPSFPLIKNICRIVKNHVVLMIDESGHAYPRFWEWEFNRYGFYLESVKRPVDEQHLNLSLMVFTKSK